MEHTTKHRSSHFNSNQTSKQPASLIKGGREVEERERKREREGERKKVEVDFQVSFTKGFSCFF